ncbi:MAG TPA: hypothetical protein VG838_09500 [Opitutaceae bacterium]|nr:hypothetical protein [Opitutaceae bacterium]
MNRREFLAKTGMTAAAVGLLSKSFGADAARPASVAIVCDPSDPVAASKPARWAAEQLQQALTARGFTVKLCARLDEAAPGDLCVVAAGPASALARDTGVTAASDSEALAIGSGRIGQREVLVARGGGIRGLVYALTEIADGVADDPATALRPARAVAERPANPVRSVMRSFVSDVEDKGWYNDRDFWRRYLTMLTTQRFNRINLGFGLGYDAPNRLRDTYFYFPYPFLLAVPGYDVRATNLADAERDRNLEMLRFITDEAALRGIEFQLGLWTHAYQWTNSPDVNHNITGLDLKTQAPYSRDALAILLKECPGITGVTFRIHGESGVPEDSYDLWKTIFEGCQVKDRQIGIDMHSKGMTKEMIDVAIDTKLPVTISPKFWAEHLGLPYHQAGIRQTEMPVRARGEGAFAESNGARSFLRYGLGDLMAEDRKYAVVHRIWPGTQRVLLSGDVAFTSGYSRAMSFCGSAGCEYMEPLSFKGREGSGIAGGREGYADASLRPAGGDFEKYLLTYRYWGRLLYNPQTSPAGWQREFRREFGPAAERGEVVLRHATRILPTITAAHLPSASNNSYWPEMYANMSIAIDEPGPYSDTPAPRRFGTVSPLDPQLFSRIEDHADALLKGTVDGKFSPVEVAQWIEDLSHSVGEHLEEMIKASPDPKAPAFRRLAIDVMIQAGIGRFFGRKLRAGVLFALYQRTGDPAALREAIAHYRAAREVWAGMVAMTMGTYTAPASGKAEPPFALVGTSTAVYGPDVSYGDTRFKRGHWSDRLPAIDRDLAAMEKASVPAPATPVVPPEKLAAIIRDVTGKPARPAPNATHTAPAPFRRGQAIAVALAFPADQAQKSVRLHYRRVNQAEAWKSAPMQLADGTWRAEIPGADTDSAFPMQYYFEPVDRAGVAWIHPGLGTALSRAPYYVVRQA